MYVYTILKSMSETRLEFSVSTRNAWPNLGHVTLGLVGYVTLGYFRLG